LESKNNQKDDSVIIRTPDQHLRVFVSSTLKELAEERQVVREAILRLRLAPVMFESGARAHPSQELYRAYLAQSHIFLGIYWKSYGWVAPGATISGLEDEFILSTAIPRLIYIKEPRAERDPGLKKMLERLTAEGGVSYKYFSSADELRELVENDLALLLTEQFETARTSLSSHSQHEESQPRTNVPTPRNPLIDRREELALANKLLFQQDLGILTLTGPGGTGKSRLGLQIALDNVGKFRDGVYLVRLTPVRDPELVISTIADTLNIREANDPHSLLGNLEGYLRDKQMLLLLDNFEQVLEAAPKIAELMEACPELRIVVTSRAPLRIRGEKELFVPPLAVPAHQGFVDLQNMAQYAAVELFIQRAQSMKTDFTVTNENAPAVAEICRQLDGLPLAIELAAARVKMLSPGELLSRLGHRFDILRGGVRDLPQRQQTLRGAIDWSYDLLDESTKKLFRRLSVFVGGWTFEGAEAVCNLNGDLGPDLMDEMEALLDNNLLRQTHDEDEETRFGMLETIREYALERLTESGELEQIRRQHAQYYLEFVRRVEPLVRSRERIKYTRKMKEDLGNIRTVLNRGTDTLENLDIAQQLGIALGWFWQSSMSVVESRQWADHVLATVNASTPVIIHAGILWGAGGFAWSQGDLDQAIIYLDQALSLARKTDDIYLLANILIVYALAATSRRDVQVARAAFEESITLLRALGEKWGESLALSWLADVAMLEKDYERSRQLHEQAIEVARDQGDPWILLSPLMSGGNVTLFLGDAHQAEATCFEAIRLLRQIDDRWSLAWALNGLGHASLNLSKIEQARASFEECITFARDIGNPGALISTLVGVAILSTRLFQDQANAKEDSSSILNAVRLLGAIPALNQNVHMFFWLGWWAEVHEKAVLWTRNAIVEETWKKAYAEGEALSMQQALAIALQELQSKSLP
jgi:predicted ATPase